MDRGFLVEMTDPYKSELRCAKKVIHWMLSIFGERMVVHRNMSSTLMGSLFALWASESQEQSLLLICGWISSTQCLVAPFATN
ncbi:hypothetical protein Hdeb2414_s0023g00627201 [Helianthus debilis subsp. tardiflorus]